MALHSNGGGVLWLLGHRGKAGFVAVGLTTGCSNQHLQIPNAEQPIWSSFNLTLIRCNARAILSRSHFASCEQVVPEDAFV